MDEAAATYQRSSCATTAKFVSLDPGQPAGDITRSFRVDFAADYQYQPVSDANQSPEHFSAGQRGHSSAVRICPEGHRQRRCLYPTGNCARIARSLNGEQPTRDANQSTPATCRVDASRASVDGRCV